MNSNNDRLITMIHDLAINMDGDSSIEDYNNRLEVHADFLNTRDCDDFLAVILAGFSNVEYTRDLNFVIVWEKI